MNFEKRGVGLLISGIIIMFVTFYPVVTNANVALVIVHLAGWAMFAAGAVIRGKQKKDQRKLEDAMYHWADREGGSARSSQNRERTAAPAYDLTAERMNMLEAENAKLRRQVNDLQTGGHAQPAAERLPWTCPYCGSTGKGNFCENCGARKP